MIFNISPPSPDLQYFTALHCSSILLRPPLIFNTSPPSILFNTPSPFPWSLIFPPSTLILNTPSPLTWSSILFRPPLIIKLLRRPPLDPQYYFPPPSPDHQYYFPPPLIIKLLHHPLIFNVPSPPWNFKFTSSLY